MSIYEFEVGKVKLSNKGKPVIILYINDMPEAWNKDSTHKTISLDGEIITSDGSELNDVKNICLCNKEDAPIGISIGTLVRHRHSPGDILVLTKKENDYWHGTAINGKGYTVKDIEFNFDYFHGVLRVNIDHYGKRIDSILYKYEWEKKGRWEKREMYLKNSKKPINTIKNKTPHVVNLLDNQNSTIAFWGKAERPFRLEEKKDSVNPLLVEIMNEDLMVVEKTIPLNKVSFGSTELPKEESGIYYIVSLVVQLAFPERNDLLVPFDLVRNEKGVIIGCKAFSI